MTKVDLEVVKIKQGIQLKKWNKIDQVIHRGSLVGIWILGAFVIGLSIGIPIGKWL